MKVVVVYWGPAREWTGVRQEHLELITGATLESAAGRMFEDHARLRTARGGLRFAVNGRFAEDSTPLHDGDEIGVIPPVSGGADDLHVGLATGAIDAREIRALVDGSGRCGGVVVFEGVTRAESHPTHGVLVRLAYEVFGEMAISEMTTLANEARSRFAVERVAMVHRTGDVGIGETSVAIAVGAAHRGPAFDACRWLIDAVKTEVPIWKQEVWADGTTDWVDPTAVADEEKR